MVNLAKIDAGGDEKLIINLDKYRLHTEPEVCNILVLWPQFELLLWKMQIDK